VYKILANLPFRTNNVHYLPSCHSTNEVAHDLLQADAEEGTIVITDNQMAGKGQGGNQWISPPNLNLTFSLILKPSFLVPNQQFLITIAMSLGIKDALEEVVPGEIKVKWPNDIYFDNKKIAGILIENVLRGNSFDSCIVGIGINVNQTLFEDLILATSIKAIIGRTLDLNKELNNFLAAISAYYNKLKGGDFEILRAEYHSSLLGLNESREFTTIDGKFKGIIRGTDEVGRLLIECDGKVSAFQHKEVQLIL